MPKTAVSLATALVALVTATGAAAAVPTSYHISSTADGDPGTCSAPVGSTETCTTLRAAVLAIDHNNAANATISLGPGRYVLGGTGGTDGALGITAPVTIIGAGADETAVVQTDGKDEVFELYDSAGKSAIDDLEVTGGADGGIDNTAGLTLDGDLIEDNHINGATPAEGGGIDNASQNLPMTIISSSVIDNQVTGATGSGASGSTPGGAGEIAEGGGIDSTSPISITDSTIAGNTVTGGEGGTAQDAEAGDGGEAFGGGIEAIDGMVLNRDTIDDNRAVGGQGGSTLGTGDGGTGETGAGGGVDLQPVSGITDQIVNSMITGNSSSPGAPGMSSNGGANGFAGGTAGGGLSIEGGATTLANVTITANAAPAGIGGNVFVFNHNGASVTFGDTIIAGGSAIAGAGNCGVADSPSLVDGGSNLEDSGAGTSECHLSPSRDHLVAAGGAGVAASLAANGGPTETLALLAGSPALGAGGVCTDPTASGAPLLEDQRGLPRPSGGPCDIGAFQAQPVKAGEATISGTAGSGHTLTCAATGFGGDGPFTYAYVWTRDGRPVGGVTGASYPLHLADSGAEVACRVTVTGPRGSASAASAADAVAAGVPSIASKRITVSKSGRASVSISCHASEPCLGTLTLAKGRKHVLRSARFTIPAGRTAKITVRLSKTELKLFNGHRNGFEARAAVSYRKDGLARTTSRPVKVVLG
jgi:hypothetical protein